MFKTAYTPDDSEKCATINLEESLTQQADAKDCDINIIMERYAVTGQLPQVTALQPLFADFTTVTDYKGALDLIRKAEEAFAAVPAKIRQQFGNNAQAFIDFAENPDNLETLRKWGLANPKQEKTNGERPEGSIDTRPGTQPNRQGNPGTSGLPDGKSDDRLHEKPTGG